jgi:cytochrome c oxidase subunit 1
VTVVGGTTLAFMALTYYVVPLIFQKEFYAKGLCKIQPYLFGGGIVMAALGMSFAGSYGVPRRHWDVGLTGGTFAHDFGAGADLMLGVMGVGAVVAFLALLLFVLLVVAAVFFGRSNAGVPMTAWQHGTSPIAEGVGETTEEEDHNTPGTLVLVAVFLLSFVVYYFANWKWLSDVWEVR